MLLLCFSGTKFNTMNSVSALIIQRFLDKVHNTVNVTIPLLPGEKDIIKTLSHARSCVFNEYLYFSLTFTKAKSSSGKICITCIHM